MSPSACEVWPQDDSSAMFCLEQNPDFNGGEWALAGGVLPTLTRVNTHMYNPSEERWLTGREKMNAMGFPVFDETADAAGIPRVNISDIQASVHKAAGNSMAIRLFALPQIAIYSCIEFESVTPSTVPVPAVLAKKFPKGIAPLKRPPRFRVRSTFYGISEEDAFRFQVWGSEDKALVAAKEWLADGEATYTSLLSHTVKELRTKLNELGQKQPSGNKETLVHFYFSKVARRNPFPEVPQEILNGQDVTDEFLKAVPTKESTDEYGGVLLVKPTMTELQVAASKADIWVGAFAVTRLRIRAAEMGRKMIGFLI